MLKFIFAFLVTLFGFNVQQDVLDTQSVVETTVTNDNRIVDKYPTVYGHSRASPEVNNIKAYVSSIDDYSYDDSG